MTIGILAVQGSFAEHARMLSRLGVSVRLVKTPLDMAHLHGIILPGGESTAMARLLTETGMHAALTMAIGHGMPTLATCAGTILLAKNTPYGFGLLDVDVERNAYGRQQASFRAPLSHVDVSLGCTTLEAICIRAPRITRVGSGVRTLALLDASPMLVRQQHMLAMTFHPELTQDTTIHAYFLSHMIEHV